MSTPKATESAAISEAFQDICVRRFFFFILTVDTVTDAPIPHPAPTPRFLWPSPHCCLCLRLLHICSLANPFPFFHLVPPLSQQSVPCRVHASVSILSGWGKISNRLSMTQFSGGQVLGEKELLYKTKTSPCFIEEK